MMDATRIHLDTHVVLWLYNGEAHLLSQSAKASIEAGALEISPMVELEIQYLLEIGRFRDGPTQVLAALTRDYGVRMSVAPFPSVIAEARKLHWTRDSFDRLITAQAACEGAQLVTRDRRIRENYAGAVW
ncbi:MAG: PIN domain-containing protein [Pseudomonadota bacterium]|nr:PIN domain-containing protein [Pseudomonadota bacterium]